MPDRKRGSLTVVGTGYSVGGQTTAEARAHLEIAERLVYATGDPVSRLWVEGINPRAETLTDAYAAGKLRRETYREMVERILAPVRRGERVCAAFYGHPGVGVEPSHAAIRRARDEGFEARMLPGVSAEDCLFADLGLNPLSDGCQSFEATDFLLRGRTPDTAVPLILWQIGIIGVEVYREEQLWSREGLALLAEVLGRHYPPEHECTVYEAAMLPVCAPVIERVVLRDLPETPVTTASTLYVPLRERAPVDPAMRERLGLGRGM
ncbi:MAG TPA: SAM-dependent methyltransferase [Thermoanaerobaculia bacterium]|nr:SAM-dependent methyltransferase [Thermoanaerobaculia bacterium]